MPLLVLLALSAVSQPSQAPPAPERAPAEPRGLLRKSDAASPGYTLFAPLRSHKTYLVDLDGRVVHEWTSDAPPGQSVELLPDGRLLRCERVPNRTFGGGGEGGRLRELEWDGTVAWEYVCSDDSRLQHHDAAPLPNGNVLLIAWERKSADEALAAGRDPALVQPRGVWPDMVLEIEPLRPKGGKVVWEWHAWDHLVQDRDPELPAYGAVAENPHRIDIDAAARPPEPTPEEREGLARLRHLGYLGDDAPLGVPPGFSPGRGADLFHSNSIDYSPELDLIVLSSRELSELWFIDHSTSAEQARGSSGGRWGRGGDLVFRWGHPRWHGGAGPRTLFGQHDAHWIAPGLPGAGHVLLFNNGEPGVREGSSADELEVPLTPETSKQPFAPGRGVEVELVASLRSPDFSSHLSGAQRLANGNTLLCAGESGRIVELTPTGEVAWEYLNPHGGGPGPLGGPTRPPETRGGERVPPGIPPPRPDGPRGDPRVPGPLGPGSEFALFRATRLAPDHPGLARLAR